MLAGVPSRDAAVVADPVGAVLAGGRARRLGGDKAGVEIGRRAMIERPLEALGEVCDGVVVVCKAATALPGLPRRVERWDEPDQPRHPVTGIVHALERAGGPVLVCAADMPFVDAALLRVLLAAGAAGPDAAAVIAQAGGRLQPVLGLYRVRALEGLGGEAAHAPLTATVERLDPMRVEVAAAAVRSVNTPAELAAADAELGAAGTAD